MLRRAFLDSKGVWYNYGGRTNRYGLFVPSDLGPKASSDIADIGKSDYIWGVLDLIPDTDFPDIRNRCAVHSHNGSCMIIPREGDKVRLYIQLADQDVLDSKGRVDKSKVGPEKIMEVANKSLYPYVMSTSHPIDWWTLYISTVSPFVVIQKLTCAIVGQRVANKYTVHERVLIAGDACHTHSPKAGKYLGHSLYLTVVSDERCRRSGYECKHERYP